MYQQPYGQPMMQQPGMQQPMYGQQPMMQQPMYGQQPMMQPPMMQPPMMQQPMMMAPPPTIIKIGGTTTADMIQMQNSKVAVQVLCNFCN